MLKNIAITFGAILLIVGVLGFIPALAPNGLLFGIFEVGPLHNIVHLLTGAAAVAVGFASEYASQTYFKVFGVVYALVAILGFFFGDQDLLGIMAHNWPDVWLHVAIAVVALYLGFGMRTGEEVKTVNH